MKVDIRSFAFFIIAVCIYGSLVTIINHINSTSGNMTTVIRNSKLSKVILNMKKLYTLSNSKFQNGSEEEISTRDKKTIVFFNLPHFEKYKTMLKLSENCEYQNCFCTRKKSKLLEADAVLFYIGRSRIERMGIAPPINKSSRNPNQVWIFMSHEPPNNFRQTDYRLNSWENTMNWSIHYTLDSDIPIRYGTLVKKSAQPNKDYLAIYKKKTRNALWVVSHNHTFSKRDHYVREMVRSGFDVDIKGLAGQENERITPEKLMQIIPLYKFYLGFENALCNDYVTEKYFKNYNNDWLVVVRGGADYHRLLPAKTFISTSDFSNISSLVDYLTDLGNNRDKYIERLRYKDNYTSITDYTKTQCEICRRLNNLSKFRKTYHKMADAISKDQCFRPKDPLNSYF